MDQTLNTNTYINVGNMLLQESLTIALRLRFYDLVELKTFEKMQTNMDLELRTRRD